MSALLTCSEGAGADEPLAADRFWFQASSQTYGQLFQQALLPGPGGARVRTDTRLPFLQYVSLAGDGFDTRLGEDTASFELAAWASADTADIGYDDRYQGDVQTALVRLHTSPGAHPASVTLGRQSWAGGAARFVRFDGASGNIEIIPALSLSAYGGLAVLPRWNQRPGYYHLGSAADTLVDSPEVLQDPARKDYTLAGGRLQISTKRLVLALSVHEQHEKEGLSRRNLGVDLQSPVTDRIDFGTTVLLDLDKTRLANALVFADFALTERIDVSAEYLRTEPSLLLSQQSVLSVFSTSSYQETGGSATFRALSFLTLSGNGFVQSYEDEGIGTRLNASLVFRNEAPSHTLASLTYGRVDAMENGYHSIHGAVSQRLSPKLVGTMQTYAYLYDVAISGYASSLVHSATMEYSFWDQWALLAGGSLARSPYASLDASTQVRLSYQFHSESRGSAW